MCGDVINLWADLAQHLFMAGFMVLLILGVFFFPRCCGHPGWGLSRLHTRCLNIALLFLFHIFSAPSINTPGDFKLFRD